MYSYLFKRFNMKIGDVYDTTSCGKLTIVQLGSCSRVVVKFLNTGSLRTVDPRNVRKGTVKDMYAPTVYGVGIIGEKYPIKLGGKVTKEYGKWKNMLARCSNLHHKNFKTYQNCEVSENFKSYEYFYEWCNKQVGFSLDNFELDKDLLYKGNRIYSENTCVFLPKEVNQVLTKSDNIRGTNYIGVSYNKSANKFRAYLYKNDKEQHLGYFKTEIEAFNAYKIAKENYLKELAEKWKDKIDHRAYNALMNYQVEITD